MCHRNLFALLQSPLYWRTGHVGRLSSLKLMLQWFTCQIAMQSYFLIRLFLIFILCLFFSITLTLVLLSSPVGWNVSFQRVCFIRLYLLLWLESVNGICSSRWPEVWAHPDSHLWTTDVLQLLHFVISLCCILVHIWSWVLWRRYDFTLISLNIMEMLCWFLNG